MTTYCSNADVESVLEGFIVKYYGSYIDGDPENMQIGTTWDVDMKNSFQQTNDLLRGISHIKHVPVGTQTDGDYPYAIRMLQANLLIYNRLKNRHYGEFTDGIPGWINVYLTRSRDIYEDIVKQRSVFDEDTSQGESGIARGSYATHNGIAKWYTNWETGIYSGVDYRHLYVVEIDGTTVGSQVGQSTFKWSRDGGISWVSTQITTSTAWIGLESGLGFRWEPPVTGTSAHLPIGDRYDVLCTPMNIPVKSAFVKQSLFIRG